MQFSIFLKEHIIFHRGSQPVYHTERQEYSYTVPDIIKFTYYHCTTQYYAIICKCKGNSHIAMVTVHTCSSTVILLRCIVDYHSM